MGWRVVFFIVVLFSLQGFVYYHFLKFLKSTKVYKPSLRWWALVPFLLFNVPFIVISIFWGRSFAPPEWFKIIGVYPFHIWQGATFFLALWLLVGKIIKLPFKLPLWIAKLIKPLREKIASLKQKKAVKAVDYSRRKFVRYATFGASAYAFGGATYGIVKHDAYEIDYKDIVIENLPPELRGTTITLISDIHSGQYMDENDMREYADVVNSLGSDIICIPGDFVNFEVKDVHPLTKAFRDLKAKHGVYGSLGNHDFFMDPEYVTKAIREESPIQLLRNEHRVINIKGKDLYMLGIDDTISSGAKMDEVLKYYGDMDEFLKTNDPKYTTSPKVLMCHKPYGFDILAKKEPDLILSGHTHGGQVVPVKFGNFHLSFASTVSKYIDGLYKIGKSNMYVSRGLGSVALPIRINCPPEITVLKLV
jgi:uncharacterized protein